MTDLISRQMAIESLRKMLYKLEEEREEYYIKEKKVDEWFIYIRPNVQDMNDLDVETIDSLPSANPWHTGTPTEEGWYLVTSGSNNSASYDIGKWDGESFCYMEYLDSADVVAWQKIEPYEASEEREEQKRVCGNCKWCHEGHYEEEGEEPYIKRSCLNKYGLTKDFSVNLDDFCSRWKEKEDGR